MSLNWDLSKIENYQTLCWEKIEKIPAMGGFTWRTAEDGSHERLNIVTDCLIWATLGIDLGSITEENAEEFYMRHMLYKAAIESECDYWTDGGKKKFFITLEDVRAHIGLSTNVSSKKWTSFAAHLKSMTLRSISELKSKKEKGAA